MELELGFRVNLKVQFDTISFSSVVTASWLGCEMTTRSVPFVSTTVDNCTTIAGSVTLQVCGAFSRRD